MDVVSEDPLWAKRREVKYRWMRPKTQDVSDSTPPHRWFEAICGEVEFQRMVDLQKKMGRTLL